MTSLETSHKKINTPVGTLTLLANDTHLLAVLWDNDGEQNRVKIDLGKPNPEHGVLVDAEKQLNEYFLKQRQSFDIPIQFTGTDFQKKVWNVLLEIPYGETRTYIHIAKQLGDPKATRAVGLANGKNPLSIIAPCHRVVGSSGKLTGFAGGLENKAYLLQLERAKITPTLF